MKNYGELKKALKVKNLSFEQKMIDGKPSLWKSVNTDDNKIKRIFAKVDCKITDKSEISEVKPGEWLVRSEYAVVATFVY